MLQKSIVVYSVVQHFSASSNGPKCEVFERKKISRRLWRRKREQERNACQMKIRCTSFFLAMCATLAWGVVIKSKQAVGKRGPKKDHLGVLGGLGGLTLGGKS